MKVLTRAGSARILVGPPAVEHADAGLVHLNAAAGVTADAETPIDYDDGSGGVPAPDPVTADKTLRKLNIVNILRTGEKVMVYDKPTPMVPSVAAFSARRTIGIMEYYFCAKACGSANASWAQALVDDDEMDVIAEWFDFSLKSVWKSHDVLEGVSVAVEHDSLFTTTDQKGKVNAYTQEAGIKVTAKLPLDTSVENQRFVLGDNIPVFIREEGTPTPEDFQAVYISKSGIMMCPVSLLIIPEYAATACDERTSEGEIKTTEAWFIPRAIPNVARTFGYTKGDQLALEVEYDAMNCPFFEYSAVQSMLSHRKAHYPSD